MKSCFCTLLLIVVAFSLKAQNNLSIHQEQHDYYAAHPYLVDDSKLMADIKPLDAKLGQFRVFGYQPYWTASAFSSYQWSLLSDICWFSYDLNPQNGLALTTHDFLTAPVIDTALLQGVKVHLCVTLFSHHAQFLGNIDARQTFFQQVVSLIEQRGAHGVNIDFEAIPSSQKELFQGFLKEFSLYLQTNVPGVELSVAIPAVDWHGMFDPVILNDYIDQYVIMGYDYYWGGAEHAGPSDPLYTMSAVYDYNISRSLSRYQAKGMPAKKMILGLPYYGRDWQVNANVFHAPTVATGKAVSYAVVRNNVHGYYSQGNKHFEKNGVSTLYAYFDKNWHHCFINDGYTLGERMDIIRYRNLSGMGIWALGYDDGYDDYWKAIAEHLSDSWQPPLADTLFDSGGDVMPYYNGENYQLFIEADASIDMQLRFVDFSLESGFDTLKVYEQTPMGNLLRGAFSGDDIPEPMDFLSNKIILSFNSDNATVRRGWKMIWCDRYHGEKEISYHEEGFISPNPATGFVQVKNFDFSIISVFDMQGVERIRQQVDNQDKSFRLNVNNLPSGIYLVYAVDCQHQIKTAKLLID